MTLLVSLATLSTNDNLWVVFLLLQPLDFYVLGVVVIHEDPAIHAQGVPIETVLCRHKKSSGNLLQDAFLGRYEPDEDIHVALKDW